MFKISCKQIIETSDAYIDNSLSFSERIGIWLHTLVCKPCRLFINYYKGIYQGDMYMPKEISDDQASRIVEKVMLDNDKECGDKDKTN